MPEFDDCPYFGGSNEASPENTLPGDAYRDIIATGMDPKELLKATKKDPAVAAGSAEISRTENCANIVQSCGESVTYSATATVRTFVKFLFTPRKKKH